MVDQATSQPGVYRMAPELRRSAIYAMVGFFFLGSIAAWVGHFLKQRNPVEIGLVVAVNELIALAMIIPLRWALRIDVQGISRRWLWGWDCWPWSDFASGRIKKEQDYLVDPQRSWWIRKLRLGYLEPADLKAVMDQINRHYRLPPPLEIPDTMTIKYGFRKAATFDWKGISLLVVGQNHEYAWNDVRRIRITRRDSLRRDFVSLELFLPDQEIELKFLTHGGGTSPTWRGPGAEEVKEFLLAQVAKEKVDLEIEGEPPTRPEDVEKLLRQVQQRRREIRMIWWIILPPLAGILIYTAIFEKVIDALKILGMGVFLGSFYTPVLWFIRKSLAEEKKKLETWLAELQNSVLGR